MSVGILFPGQGSQTVGMGADLFDARDDLLGDRADEILGFSLRTLCLDGPEEELGRTQLAQPALFAVSYALWEMIVAENDLAPRGCRASLGEYTALAAAGVFDFDTALRLVSLRGEPWRGRRPGGLRHGGPDRRRPGSGPGGDQGPPGPGWQVGSGQCQCPRPGRARRRERRHRVVGGELFRVRGPAGRAPQRGGAFHSQFMIPAQEELTAALETIEISEPRFPVWSNTTARPHESHEIGDLLARQMVEPVLFSDSLLDMSAAGIDTFLHVGPGDVTAGLARRTVQGAAVRRIAGIDDIRST